IRAVVDAGVVAGGDGVGAEAPGVVQKRIELDFAVAQNVGIGGATGGVAVEKITEYAFLVLAREVGAVQRDAEHGTDFGGVIAIGGGLAAPGFVLAPVEHEQALDMVAGL